MYHDYSTHKSRKVRPIFMHMQIDKHGCDTSAFYSMNFPKAVICMNIGLTSHDDPGLLQQRIINA